MFSLSKHSSSTSYNSILIWLAQCIGWSRRPLVLLLLVVCSIVLYQLTHSCFISMHRWDMINRKLITFYSPQAAEELQLLMIDTDYFTFEAFFKRATSGRNSSYPFISGDTFRAMADHIFDETTDVNQWTYRVSEIKQGDIVFLSSEADIMPRFFNKTLFKRIRHPFVLITHNSDSSAPTNDFQWVLDSKRILAWFASNPDHVHKKLFPIPIGLANTRWAHGNISNFKRAVSLDRKPFSERTNLLYVNFNVQTNEKARSKALQWALTIPNITQTQPTSHESYLRDLGNTKFVLSPTGNGLDCHRTWEAILMGAVPIVLRSPLDPLFANTAVLIVDDWHYLTIEYLESLNYKILLSERLFAKYW